MKSIYLAASFILIALSSFSQNSYFQATLDGSQEVPANASGASGVVVTKYNTTTKLLELWGDYKDLSAVATGSHIHSPAAAGVNAPVLITLTNTGGTSGNLTGSATLTAGQETDLFAGNMYVNVHNASFPGGEIRGQLTETTDGQTSFFAGCAGNATQHYNRYRISACIVG